jgi:hypothetical protein
MLFHKSKDRIEIKTKFQEHPHGSLSEVQNSKQLPISEAHCLSVTFNLARLDSAFYLPTLDLYLLLGNSSLALVRILRET